MDGQCRQRRAGRVQRGGQARLLRLHAGAGPGVGGVQADVQLAAGQHELGADLAQAGQADRASEADTP